MNRISISSDDQILRIEAMRKRIKEIQSHPEHILKKPSEQSWSILEIIEHMYLGFLPYRIKLSSALEKCRNRQEAYGAFRARWWPSLLLQNFPPQKDGNIKLKMKTMEKFEPKTSPQVAEYHKIESIFDEFYSSLDELKTTASKAQFKQIRDHKFNSSIGPIVRFYIPECIEFILRHNERHMNQIERTLISVSE